MTLDEALSARLAIWGMGAEGTALARLALDSGAQPVLIDDQPLRAQSVVATNVGIDISVVDPGAVDWGALDVVVRSPGVSRYRPELAAAAASGVRVTTAMALWLADHADDRLLAITGTKGKSTTAALTAAVLERDGWSVDLLGNIGVPVVGGLVRPPSELTVVEVSSYQAADVTVSPPAVVLTCLAPDHLDWHGGLERYYTDKLQLVEAGPPPALAVGAFSPEALERTAHHSDRTLFGPRGRVVADDDGWIRVDGEALVDWRDLRLPGRHNVWNLCGAIAGVIMITGRAPSSEAVGAAVTSFEGLPSRCRPVGERQGRTYVDDALASNPFAAATSIGAFPNRPLTVIVGGADRGVDVTPLIDALVAHGPSAAVVVLEPDADRFVDLLAAHGEIDVHVADDVGGAVAIAERLTPRGGVVLFSPAAPTPAGGGGYSARSRTFVEAAGLA